MTWTDEARLKSIEARRLKALLKKRSHIKAKRHKSLVYQKKTILSTPKGTGTKADPYRTSDIQQAARLLSEGSHVRLKHKRQVSLLVDELSKMVDDAVSKGDAAPAYDLCKVTVKKTNLFCAKSLGIPRLKMPQFKGTAVKGSKADALPRNKRGNVDVTEAFLAYLKSQKIGVKNDKVDASVLKASQAELDGSKVAGMFRAHSSGEFDVTDEQIWVTRDDYIVDGHHRWAVAVTAAAKKGKPVKMPVRVIDAEISEILRMGVEWTAEFGLERKGIAQAPAGGRHA